MPKFTDELKPANIKYEDNDKILNTPVHWKYNPIENAIDDYRRKNRENTRYKFYDKTMDAEIHHERVGDQKPTEEEKAVLSRDTRIQHAVVENGFLAMEDSNPMMRFAEEIHEGMNLPPYFEANIFNADHEDNMTNVHQHTYATMRATVYNKTQNRMVRYRFGVGLHMTGLEFDQGGGAQMVARKVCTYEDLHKAFSYIAQYQYKRNTSWRLLSTNCNNFVRELAELIGMNDLASLMRSVSCVQTLRNMMKAAASKGKSDKYKDIQFFSEEAMKEGDQKDSNVAEFGAINQFHTTSNKLELPEIIRELDENLIAINLKLCGYKEFEDFDSDYLSYLNNQFPKYRLLTRRKFKIVREALRCFEDVYPAVFNAKMMLKSFNDMLEESQNEQIGGHKKSEEDIRRERAMAIQYVTEMVDKGLDKALSKLNYNAKPYRYFIMRCKGALRGMESVGAVIEDISDAGFTMDTTFSEAERESSFAALEPNLLDKNYTKEEIEQNKNDYANALIGGSSFNNNLSRLGYTFIRSLTMASNLIVLAEEDLTNKEKAGKVDVGNAAYAINNIAARVREINVTNPKGDEPVYVFLSRMLEVDSVVTRDPDLCAWTLVQSILNSIHNLWKRRLAELGRKFGVAIDDRDFMSNMLVAFQMEHGTQLGNNFQANKNAQSEDQKQSLYNLSGEDNQISGLVTERSYIYNARVEKKKELEKKRQLEKSSSKPVLLKDVQLTADETKKIITRAEQDANAIKMCVSDINEMQEMLATLIRTIRARKGDMPGNRGQQPENQPAPNPQPRQEENQEPTLQT